MMEKMELDKEAAEVMREPLEAQMRRAAQNAIAGQQAAMREALANQMASTPELPAQTPDMKNKVQMALKVVRAQPGRPPKEEMIKTLMRQKGMTRAQAKEQIHRFDMYMAHKFIQEQETANLSLSIHPSRINPLTKALFAIE